jgi:hypothetical protein
VTLAADRIVQSSARVPVGVPPRGVLPGAGTLAQAITFDVGPATRRRGGALRRVARGPAVLVRRRGAIAPVLERLLQRLEQRGGSRRGCPQTASMHSRRAPPPLQTTTQTPGFSFGPCSARRMDRKVEEEPIAAVWATTRTQRAAAWAPRSTYRNGTSLPRCTPKSRKPGPGRVHLGREPQARGFANRLRASGR